VKTALSYFGAALSFGFLFASAIINYQFGTRLAETEALKHVMGAVAVMAVGYNAICPFLLQWWKNKISRTLVCVLWILCLVYTATSAIGFAAENRALVQNHQLAQNENLSIYHDMLRDEKVKKKKDEKKIEQLRLKIMSMNEKGAATAPDPQAHMLSIMTTFSQNTVRAGLVVLFALLIELGATLGLYCSLGHVTERKPTLDWRGNPLK
jgi:hypothetical protein